MSHVNHDEIKQREGVTARITPLEWEKLAEATRALRTKPAQLPEKRSPLHKPQPWNPPVARRRKR